MGSSKVARTSPWGHRVCERSGGEHHSNFTSWFMDVYGMQITNITLITGVYVHQQTFHVVLDPTFIVTEVDVPAMFD